jgi:hypothetical protein
MGVGSIISLVALRMRFPHYFALFFVPLLVYLAGEIALAWRPMSRRGIPAVALAAMLVAGLAGGIARMAWPTDVMTMREAAQWLAENARPGDVVVTEEPIEKLVAFPSCWIEEAEKCDDTYSWVVTYESLTQQLSLDPAARRFLGEETEPCVVFEGFKETVTVYAHTRGDQNSQVMRSCPSSS